jgi:hypothetical protein
MSVPPLSRRDMERMASRFNARYGVTTSWSDEQIERALSDHGLPRLAAMPDYDDSTAARAARKQNAVSIVRGPYGSPDSPVERHRWQRVNAMHLLGHVIANHPEPRCRACRTWGASDDDDSYRKIPEDGG